MRASAAIALVISSTACDYRTDLKDCFVACSATSPDCPAGFNCQTSEGLCRPPGAPAPCASILGDAAVDTRPVDAAADGAPDAPQAVIVFDAASNATVTNASTMTWQHTVGASLTGSLLVVGVSIEKSGAAVSGITFATVPMVRAAASVGGSNTRAELWYLKAPQAGNHPVVVTFSPAVGADGAVAGAVSLSGVDQTTPVPTTVGGGGTTGNLSTTITTVNNNAWIIDVVQLDSSMKTVGANTGQMPRWNLATNPGSNGITGAGSTRATTSHGAYTMSWTPNPSPDNWAQVVAEIKP